MRYNKKEFKVILQWVFDIITDRGGRIDWVSSYDYIKGEVFVEVMFKSTVDMDDWYDNIKKELDGSGVDIELVKKYLSVSTLNLRIHFRYDSFKELYLVSKLSI